MTTSFRSLPSLVASYLLLSACSHAATPAPSSPVFILNSVTPPSGAMVTRDSVFHATVRYRIPDFAPGLWRIVVLFEYPDGQSFVGLPTTDTDVVPDSAGVLQITQSFAAVWTVTQLARPFHIQVWLNRNEGNGRSHAVMKLGPFIYQPVP